MNKFKNIYVEITKLCNLNCPFCTNKTSSKDYMPFDKFQYVINQIKDYTDSIYLHILGEPLLHKDIFKIIEFASKKVKVNMTTNGRLITNYKEKLLDSKIRLINVSLQSLIVENNYVIDKYLSDLVAFINDERRNFAVNLRLWNDKKNESIAKFNKYILLKLEESRILTKKNVHLSIQDEFAWPTIDDAINNVNSSCLGGKNQMGILSNGDVVICCLDTRGNTKLGNVFEKNFKDIINSEEYKKIILGWNNHKPYMDLCKRCTYRNRFK